MAARNADSLAALALELEADYTVGDVIRRLLSEPLPWGVLEEARAALYDLDVPSPETGTVSAPDPSDGEAPLAQTLFHGIRPARAEVPAGESVPWFGNSGRP